MSDKKDNIECSNCGTEISPEEIAHDAFNDGLNSITQLVSFSGLNAVHYLTLGLAYFLDQIYNCAPDKEEAERVINKTVTKLKKEQNNG
tara:strand:+ start:1106 stop:1372 length:267 start_codon:yes stop_codon:yes gene_type:complete